MRFETLDDIPNLDQVLDLQQSLSASHDVGELIYTFADRFYKNYGVEAVMGLDVIGLPAGTFRVMDFIDARGGLSPKTALANARWDQPRDEIPAESGGLAGRFVLEGRPSLALDLDPSADDVLSRFTTRRSDVLSIPVFREGELAEWFLVFRAPGAPVDPVLVRLLVSMFNMFSRLIVTFKLHQEVAGLNGKLDAKLQEVAEVQRSILPTRPPAYPTMDIAVHYRPCDMAGGDYYDFRSFDDGSMGVVIADVAGHGPGAAVVMAMLRTAISIDRTLHAGAGDVVETVNRFLWDGLSAGTFVTAFFLKLHPDHGRVDYASAGHWPALVRKADGRLLRLDQGGGPPIGMIQEIGAAGGTAQLDPGDAVLLYTDGITEAFSPGGEVFGAERLSESFQTGANGCAQATLDAVCHAVDLHTRGVKQSDDQCMVAIRFNG